MLPPSRSKCSREITRPVCKKRNHVVQRQSIKAGGIINIQTEEIQSDAKRIILRLAEASGFFIREGRNIRVDFS
jgi:hypothetical protein